MRQQSPPSRRQTMSRTPCASSASRTRAASRKLLFLPFLLLPLGLREPRLDVASLEEHELPLPLLGSAVLRPPPPSSSCSFLLTSSAQAARKESAEESTTSPDAPASTSRPRVGWVSPAERRTVRSLRSPWRFVRVLLLHTSRPGGCPVPPWSAVLLRAFVRHSNQGHGGRLLLVSPPRAQSSLPPSHRDSCRGVSPARLIHVSDHIAARMQ